LLNDPNSLAAVNYIISYHHIISYCTFLRRQFKNTGAAAIKQTSKFSAVLQHTYACSKCYYCIIIVIFCKRQIKKNWFRPITTT